MRKLEETHFAQGALGASLCCGFNGELMILWQLFQEWPGGLHSNLKTLSLHQQLGLPLRCEAFLGSHFDILCIAGRIPRVSATFGCAKNGPQFEPSPDTRAATQGEASSLHLHGPQLRCFLL